MLLNLNLLKSYKKKPHKLGISKGIIPTLYKLEMIGTNWPHVSYVLKLVKRYKTLVVAIKVMRVTEPLDFYSLEACNKHREAAREMYII